MTLETKSNIEGGPSEIRGAMRDFLGAFESFKDANDQRLNALESKREDVLLDEKVDRINRALDEQKSTIDRLALAAKRPGLGQESILPDERKTAFNRYVLSLIHI